MMTTTNILLAFIIGGVIGFYANWVYRKLKWLEKIKVKSGKRRQIELDAKEKAKSTLIDSEDIEQMAKLEHAEMMRKLNPQSYPDEKV